MSEIRHQNGTTDKESACRRTANGVMAKSVQMHEELCEAAEEIIQEYKDRNKGLQGARKEKKQYSAIPWPEMRATSARGVGIYWKVLRPTRGSGRWRFTATQIKRAKGEEPYPKRVFRPITDDMNYDLVVETERRLRVIERLLKASQTIQEAMREAMKEIDRE